jgi:Family of unknown function (DUF6364)
MSQVHGHEGGMRKVTLSIDDETFRRARTLAAERGQSLSALVRDLLGLLNIPTQDSQGDLASIFAALDRSAAKLAARNRISRDKLYTR